jgi:hypothetical protein
LLTLVALCANGWRSGGDMQMAKNQVQSFVLLLLVAYLLAVGLRGMRDYRILGALIVAAGCIKSLMAGWVYYTIEPHPAFATTHGDSMVFVAAATVVIALFAERPNLRTATLCLAVVPLLFVGMIANNRRLAWVELAATIFALYVISRRTRLKVLVTRTVVLALPLILGYVAAGWNSKSPVFAPVQLFRSVEDADAEETRSTLFRDLENFDLIVTLRYNPLVGAGFGRPYNEAVTLDNISAFKEYRFLPHNSVLGLWGFCGVIGFTGLMMPLVVGLFFSARSYSWAHSSGERIAAFTALAFVVIYLIHAWGDIGFAERKSIFLVSTALAVAARLAVSTGAWGNQQPEPAAMPGRF